MSEPIHGYFSLSYANYLILPRTLLQSMPEAWQWKFCDLLKQMEVAFEHVEKPAGYIVSPAKEKLVDDLTEQELEALEITVERIDCGGRTHERPCYYDRTGNELDPYSNILVPIAEDPIPHYNRGRARVEPKL